MLLQNRDNVHMARLSTQTEKARRNTNLGSYLGLVGLLGVVRSNTLSLDALSLSIILVVGAEEVDFFIVLLLLSCRGSTAEEGLAGGAGTGQGGELGLVGLDVSVPAGDGGGRLRVGSGGDRLEDDDVRLRGDVARTMGGCQRSV